VGNHPIEQAGIGLAEYDGIAAFAAAQQVIARAEVEAALGFAPAMALHTVRFQKLRHVGGLHAARGQEDGGERQKKPHRGDRKCRVFSRGNQRDIAAG
jgi:hypothetical protein